MQKPQENVNFLNNLLIFFGVLTFALMFISLIFLSGITANVIGESRGNYYGVIFVFIILGLIVLLEVLTLIKKRKREINISKLIKESQYLAPPMWYVNARK